MGERKSECERERERECVCVCVCVYCSRSQQSLVSICYKVSQAHGKRFFLGKLCQGLHTWEKYFGA